MSQRIRSDFGTLGERVAKPTPQSGQARHCLVDQRYPGIVWSWTRTESGWVGMVAYVDTDGVLRVEQLPADRLAPAGD